MGTLNIRAQSHLLQTWATLTIRAQSRSLQTWATLKIRAQSYLLQTWATLKIRAQSRSFQMLGSSSGFGTLLSFSDIYYVPVLRLVHTVCLSLDLGTVG